MRPTTTHIRRRGSCTGRKPVRQGNGTANQRADHRWSYRRITSCPLPRTNWKRNNFLLVFQGHGCNKIHFGIRAAIFGALCCEKCSNCISLLQNKIFVDKLKVSKECSTNTLSETKMHSRVFPKLNGHLVSSANSWNLISHWSINWDKFKDAVCYLCLEGCVIFVFEARVCRFI